MKSFLVGGEGLVMNFTGQGSVWIQTRNVEASLVSLFRLCLAQVIDR